MSKHVIETYSNGEYTFEDLDVFCARLSKRNISLLYKLENYLDKNLLMDNDLAEIRSLILNVSGEIKRIPSRITSGDVNERL